jgi:putative intracellular protease/amidase
MSKNLFFILILIGSIACNNDTNLENDANGNSNANNYEKSKILFISTNIDEMNNQPNGTYLIEIAVPFGEFLKNNFEIDIVSPKGGQIPVYHSGDTTKEVKLVLDSKLFKNKTGNSLKPVDINANEYAAVVIPGGYGQFWDTHSNKEILQIISDIYETGGVIGSLGHGTATLIDVKLKSGEYLVKDKTMTSFPSLSESNYMEQSNFGSLLPYDMETELLNRGAILKIYDHNQKINHEVLDFDNRLVTASFANSGKFIASEVMKLIPINE